MNLKVKIMMDYNNPNEPWMNMGYDPYKGMSEDEKAKAVCMQVVGIIIGFIIAICVCSLFGSCTTTKYVAVPEYHTDTLWQNHTLRDIIYIERHDSNATSQKGDTVIIDRWHWRDQWRDRVKTDTIYRSQTDSILVPYPVEKQVPAQLSWWQQTRLHLANILLFGLLIGVIIWIGKRYLKTLVW